MSINETLLLPIIDQSVKMVKVSFEKHRHSTKYTYKCIVPDLEVGDYVVVPSETTFGLAIAKVVEIDVPIPTELSVEYKWIVDRVETQRYRDTIDKEKDVVSEVSKQRVAHQRTQMLLALGMTPEVADQLLVSVDAPIVIDDDNGTATGTADVTSDDKADGY